VGEQKELKTQMPGASPSPRQLIGLGAAVAGSVVFGLVVGFALDSFCHTSPILLFVCLAVGVGCAVAVVAQQLRQFNRAESVVVEQTDREVIP
jgi:F0F1-type ATP synthase assembly protein I